MNKSKSAFSAALFIGIAALAGLGSAAVSPASAAIKIENKALADKVNGMLADAKAGRYAEALTDAREVDAIQGKPAELTHLIHENMIAYAINAKDYPAAIAQLDKMIASGEGSKSDHIGQALSIEGQLGNKEKAAAYAAMLGGNLDPKTRLYIAQGMATAGRYRDAIAEVQPLLQGERPSEDVLRLLYSVYFRMNDAANKRAMLEQLVLYYGKPQDWHDLLLLAHNEKGLSDQQNMDIYRLRLLVGDLRGDADYQEMAQEAMVAEFPNEAKTVLDKANAAKLLNGERAARLIKMANDSVAKDTAILADLQKRAERDPNAKLKLGLILWTYSKNKEAEDAIRAAMMQGVSDPDAAKIALGHALFSGEKRADAVKAFDSVSKDSKWATIGRLWSIYARRNEAEGGASEEHRDRGDTHARDRRGRNASDQDGAR
jgi:hypothetical protein